MSTSPVREWPTYLLKRVPESLKTDLSYEATAYATSMANVIRRILCDAYGLNCPPRRAYHREDIQLDQGTLLVRLQPELFEAVKEDASRNGRPQRDVILDLLTAHYRNENGSK